jgi:hypothetical protein
MIISQVVLQALIASYCQFSNPNISKDDKIECLTKAVNCVIIEDGSQIYKKQVEKCLK